MWVMARDHRRRRRSARGAVALAVGLVLLAASCVGSVDREEFERMVQERGGGLSQVLVLDAVAALEGGLDTDPLVVQSMTATNETVTIEAVSPEFPDEIDRYTYGGGGLDGPEPASRVPTVSIPPITLPELPEGVELPPEVQDLVDGDGGATEGSAGGATFPVDAVALDRLDELVDAAIETAGLREGYASSLNITSLTPDGPQIRVIVTNDRDDITVTFTADGEQVAAS